MLISPLSWKFYPKGTIFLQRTALVLPVFLAKIHQFGHQGCPIDGES